MSEQAANVVQLLPNNALAVDLQQLSARIRTFADRVEAGEFGPIERVCMLFEDADSVDYRCYGRPTTNMELIGMVEYAKKRAMFGAAED